MSQSSFHFCSRPQFDLGSGRSRMGYIKVSLSFVCLLHFLEATSPAASVPSTSSPTISFDTSQTHAIPANLWGVFFEEVRPMRLTYLPLIVQVLQQAIAAASPCGRGRLVCGIDPRPQLRRPRILVHARNTIFQKRVVATLGPA